MSLPSTNPNKAGQQSSIRSFFTPKQPSYAHPPSSASSSSSSRQQKPTTPLPPPPTTATATTTTTKTTAAPSQAGTNGAAASPTPTPPPTTTATAAPPPPPQPRPASLHPQATISPILPEHIPALRRITSLLLPVNYPDSFWARLSDPQSSGAFSRVLLWTDSPSSSPSSSSSSASPAKVIGGLVCRPEASPFPPLPGAADSASSLYIQSLVLLSPYRSLGLAAALLDDAARAAARGPWRCSVVWAHVWTDNAAGLRWYLARGFEREPREVEGYYFKLRPDSAWIVRRAIDGGSSGGSGSGSGSGSGDAVVAATAPAVPPSITAAAANLPLGARTPPVLAATAPSPSPNPTSPPPPPPPPPSSSSASSRPGPSPSTAPGGAGGMSFQNARPETEWNDLPADMHVSRSTSSNNLSVPGGGGSGNGSVNGGGGGSGASSRSSSAAGGRRKKDRAYPAAAFGK